MRGENCRNKKKQIISRKKKTEIRLTENIFSRLGESSDEHTNRTFAGYLLASFSILHRVRPFISIYVQTYTCMYRDVCIYIYFFNSLIPLLRASCSSSLSGGVLSASQLVDFPSTALPTSFFPFFSCSPARTHFFSTIHRSVCVCVRANTDAYFVEEKARGRERATEK